MRAIRQFMALRIGLAAVLTTVCLSCGSENPPARRAADSGAKDIWFEEVALASGIDFEHIRARTVRYWFPEIMSGGGAWLDYDGDGALDVYLVQGGELDATSPDRPGNRLFHNKGDGTFQDVTEASGTGDKSYGMGCTVGDYDGDGDEDIYVTNVGPNVLYRNEGNGTFTNVSAKAGVDHSGWGTSAAFIDYDNDGKPDLYVVNYVEWSSDREIECFGGGNERDYCHPANYKAPASDVLYHNNGDGTFTDVTVPSGISKARGNGLGLTCGDFNKDGLIDIYVANDGDPNQLWINKGDGTFIDRALITGCSVNRQGMAEAGMGVVAADIENDGDLDLFMTHLRNETNTLYLNQGEIFEDSTVTAGLSVPSISYTGFGAGVADFDQDGWQDIYLVNGRVGRTQSPLTEDAFAEPNQVFRGLANGRFEEIIPEGGTADTLIENSRAAAFGDYDRDGDIDVLVVNNGGRARLLKNVVGERGRWIMFRAVNQHNLDASGAMVRITVSGKNQWRSVQRAYSYLSSNDPRIHFGLAGADSVERVVVIWSGGKRESFGPFPAGAVHELRQGKGHSVDAL